VHINEPLAARRQKRSDGAVRRFALRLLFCVHLGGAWLSGVSPAAAAGVDDASRGTARKLGYSGVEAYQAGDYRTANEKLEKAYAVLQVPSLGLWSARALLKLGKLVEASERYTQVAQLGASGGNNEAVQKRALADAASELALLTPKIPSVVVRIEGATLNEVSVQIDGVPIAPELLGEARPVNPGPHKIEGQRGTEHAVVELVLAESEQKSASLRFASSVVATRPAAAETQAAAVPASDSSSAGLGKQRTFALIAGGVGVVGIGVGSVFGLKSKSEHDEAEKYCNGSECTDARGVSAGTDAHSAGNVSTVAMIIGGVGLAGAAVLWFTAPHPSQQQSARLGVGVGAGTLRVQGQF
jgi:hypothetical protein